MDQNVPQGRVKLVASSPSYIEMIHSWSKHDKLERDDLALYINLTIVWFQVDQNKSKPALWKEDILRSITDQWMDIPANFMLNDQVRSQSFRMLASLLNLFWSEHMNIHLIRSFKLVLHKAAADIESHQIAGFLKYAVVKPSTKPETILSNGSIRKIVAMHYSCTVIIVHRSKASCEDIENFYAVKNANGGLDYYFQTSNNDSSSKSTDNNEVRLYLQYRIL